MDNIFYWFPILFISMFVAGNFLISKAGWSDLVNRYQFDGDFRGNRYGIISARINNRVNYSNSLVLRYNKQGFYLKPVFIFSLFHKPIFIPWDEIKEIRSIKMLVFKSRELVIGSPAIAVIQMKDSTIATFERGGYIKNMSNPDKP